MVSHTVSIARGHTESVTALALSDRFLCSGGDDGNVYLWSLDESSFPIIQIPRMGPCSTVKFKPSDSNLLYSAHGQVICTWDMRYPRFSVSEWKVNDDEINSLDILDNEARMAAADDSGVVQIIDSNSGDIVRTLKKHDNICSVAKFRPKRNWQLISGGLDCRMIVSDWKGTGLGVIIFELSEIVNSNVFADTHTSTQQAHDLSDRASSESNTSTSEYADFQYDEPNDSIDEADDGPDNPRNEHVTSRSLPNSPITARSGIQHARTPRLSTSNQTSSNVSELSSQNEDEQLESTSLRATSGQVHDAWLTGLPINPPMVHSIACSNSGDFVAAGLEKSTIELFAGQGKRLAHLESLYGHRRAVSALHFIEDSHLVSGGNDYSLFIWTLGFDMDGQHITHDAKINAIEGSELQKIYIADYSPVIRLLDLSVC